MPLAPPPNFIFCMVPQSLTFRRTNNALKASIGAMLLWGVGAMLLWGVGAMLLWGVGAMLLWGGKFSPCTTRKDYRPLLLVYVQNFPPLA